MPNKADRKRPIQVKFFVDEKELGLIKARMAQLGIENMSAYLRLRRSAADFSEIVQGFGAFPQQDCTGV